MALYNPEVSTTAPPPHEPDDEIDLREYLQVLVDWWREILLVTVLAAGFAAAFLFYQRVSTPEVYQASATVVVARVLSDVNLNSGFRTQMDGSGAAAQGGAPRRGALVALVHNGLIAEAVAQELQDMPDMGVLSPAALLRRIEASGATGSNQATDLIEIEATSSTPERAAAIANSWANHYIKHINSLYGEVPDDMLVTVQAQLVRSEQEYQAAQQALETFTATNEISTLSREMEERQSIIRSLQTTRNAAVSEVISETLALRHLTVATYMGAQVQNRLLAFRQEQNANRVLFTDLVTAETENRQMALASERGARRALFEQYVDATVENRLAALRTEQQARILQFEQVAMADIENRLRALEAEQAQKATLFETLSQADVNARLAVYNERIDDRIKSLVADYDQRRRLEALLEDARGLQTQVQQTNEANLQSTALALTLLKTQVFAASGPLTGNLQLNLTELDSSNISAEDIATDIDALVAVIEERMIRLDNAIATRSDSIFSSQDYLLLDGPQAENEELYALVRESYLELFETGDLSTTAIELTDTNLSEAILSRYDELFQTGPLAAAGLDAADNDLMEAILNLHGELFGVGPLTTSSLLVSDNTPIHAAIEQLYPQLFELGSLSQMIEAIGVATELDAATLAQIQQLLELQGLDDIPGYAVLTESTDRMIGELEEEIRILQAQYEHQNERLAQLTRARDRAVAAYDTMTSKIIELELQSSASNREVSLGAPATVPDIPVPQSDITIGVAIAGLVGFMLSVLFVFAAHLLGTQPIFARLGRRPA